VNLNRWGVIEMIDATGLPVRVIPCRIDRIPGAFGEKWRWIAGGSHPICASAARRLARERLKQITRWAGGMAPWLESHAPVPPGKYRRGMGRPLLRFGPDGAVRLFRSVSDAAKYAGRSRAALHKRLLDGFPDGQGAVWQDFRPL
jgi:hypothetical protein